MGRTALNPTTHLRMISTPDKGCRLECLHCAAEWPLKFPVGITPFVKLVKAFETMHLDCKPADAAKT